MSENGIPLVRRLARPSSGADDGAVMTHVARYSRSAVMTVFHNLGGIERFTEISDQDPKWFYEKFFTRMIPKEHEVQLGASYEDMLKKLDEMTIDVTPVDKTEGAV